MPDDGTKRPMTSPLPAHRNEAALPVEGLGITLRRNGRRLLDDV